MVHILRVQWIGDWRCEGCIYLEFLQTGITDRALMWSTQLRGTEFYVLQLAHL